MLGLKSVPTQRFPTASLTTAPYLGNSAHGNSRHNEKSSWVDTGYPSHDYVEDWGNTEQLSSPFLDSRQIYTEDPGWNWLYLNRAWFNKHRPRQDGTGWQVMPTEVLTTSAVRKAKLDIRASSLSDPTTGSVLRSSTKATSVAPTSPEHLQAINTFKDPRLF